MLSINGRSNMRDTRLHWHYFKPITDQSNLLYHLAGADKTIVGSDDNPALLMYYAYRFTFESYLLGAIVQQTVRNRQRALDAGCGTGRNTSVLGKLFAAVDAFDISPVFISENKKRFSAHKNLNFFELDIADIRQLRGSYDLIFLGGLLMYLADDEALAFLHNLKTLLAPGGIIITRDTLSQGLTEYADYVKVYRSQGDYEQLFSHSGYHCLSVYNGPTRNFWASLFMRLPRILQKQWLVFSFFQNLMGRALDSGVRRTVRQSFKRQARASQLFYAYGYNL